MLSIAPLSLTVPVTWPEPFVLLVDDHEPSLVWLQKVVESAGHTCLVAASGSEALVLCDARRPSLVVTDLSMPRLDGLGLARWIKARYAAVPIMLVTGELLDGPTQAAYHRIFSAVFSKPLQVEPFLTLVDDLMPRSSREARP